MERGEGTVDPSNLLAVAPLELGVHPDDGSVDWEILQDGPRPKGLTCKPVRRHEIQGGDHVVALPIR